jgi:large subunit ribosomal protein L23
MKSPFSVIDRPIITERATILGEREQNPQYVFRVAVDANKIDIQRAIEKAFNVKVQSINTVKVKGKVKRQGRSRGKQSDWKKAFVTLQPGQKLELI